VTSKGDLKGVMISWSGKFSDSDSRHQSSDGGWAPSSQGPL